MALPPQGGPPLTAGEQTTDAAGRTLESVDVTEDIRPFAPEALRERVRAAGFAPGREWWDYGTSAHAPTAQFFTLEGSRAGPPSA